MADADSHNPVMIVVADEEDRAFAQQLSGALGYAEADILIGDASDAASILAARNGSPRYIVLDIASRGADVLDEIDRLAEQCEPGTRVVVIGAVNDVTFYRELKSRGVIEYFPKPAKIADVRGALMQAGGDTIANRGTVIAFMSAASGDGSSTLAANTAYALASEHKQSAVIVDMDFQWGMVAKNLDLSAQYGIRELFEHPDRGIDTTLIERMLVEYGPNLKLIAAPNDLRPLPPIRPETIRDLILTLQERFKYVIIDLPHLWTPWVSAALSHATHRVLIAQLWLRSATHATRLLGAWQDIGIERHSILLGINRAGSMPKQAIGPKDFERVCGKKIDAHFANDTRTIVDAENHGKTVVETAESAILARQIREFSHTFLPDGLQGKISEQQTRKRGIGGMLSSLLSDR